MHKCPWSCATFTARYLPSIISFEFVIATFSILSCQKCFLLMIKHSQAHRNSTLQYEIQQSLFRAKSWRVPLYIIKFTSDPACRMSGLLPLQKHETTRATTTTTVCWIFKKKDLKKEIKNKGQIWIKVWSGWKTRVRKTNGDITFIIIRDIKIILFKEYWNQF